ncbi:hypothetical protein PYCCODRAFT_1450026 [Trametes coccinea BRFM310]|uniref:DUF6533 domain-containing protein n=1 Tax=Trametes coccinea (strain BRFM310) TaxID=1353009 RepID=A0A1Y2J1I0_TRAC3|nr:hypothetical protein PYCCODRAFT_1450026 [Trametes coccinea BRFM310]
MDLNVYLNSTAPSNNQLSQEVQLLFAALSQSEDASRSIAAALALLTWDILTTMDKEVKLMWPIQNAQIVIPCVPLLIFQITSTFLVEAAVEVIIMFRVYAVYAAQPKIMRIMLLGFAIQVTLMSVSLGLSIDKVKTGWYCKTTDLPTEMVIYSTASIVYEAFLFAMMMYGLIRAAKEGFSDTTLVNALVRDGAVAFIAIFAVMIMNTILFTLAPSTLVTLGFPWSLAILGSAGPRLILNIRASHARAISKGPSSFGDLHSSMPAHPYSALDLDDSSSAGRLPPTTGSSASFPAGGRIRERDVELDLAAEWDSDSDSEDGVCESTVLNRRRGTDLESGSEGGSQSPASPLSPRTP